MKKDEFKQCFYMWFDLHIRHIQRFFTFNGNDAKFFIHSNSREHSIFHPYGTLNKSVVRLIEWLKAEYHTTYMDYLAQENLSFLTDFLCLECREMHYQWIVDMRKYINDKGDWFTYWKVIDE